MRAAGSAETLLEFLTAALGAAYVGATPPASVDDRLSVVEAGGGSGGTGLGYWGTAQRLPGDPTQIPQYVTALLEALKTELEAEIAAGGTGAGSSTAAEPWDVDGANWTDQTAQLSGSSVTMEGRSKAVLLPADADDALYLGNRDGLRAVGWELSAAGSYTGLRLEYSTATGWARLRATDTTAGLTQSGSMVWAMPKDWARVSLPGQPANLRALRWVRLVCDGCTTRAGGSLTGYWEQQEPLYTGGLYRVGGEPLQPWNASLEIDCLLPLGKRLFAVCYDPDGTQPASVVEVR